MNFLIHNSIFYSEITNFKRQHFLAFCFPFFTTIALTFDSSFFANHFFEATIVTNLLSIGYFLLMYLSSNTELRKLMFIMVFLSYVGEIIFCKILNMYSYRNNDIPLYVPFGHAIVYASGYIISKTNFSLHYDDKLKKIFPFIFINLFLVSGIILKDTFTLFFGLFYFLILKRKKWSNLYNFIALCVIFIELTGTFLQCWKWDSLTLGFFKTANPPMGAIFFYAGGDLLLAKIVSYWKNEQL